jgi:hypothetical protein
VNARWVALKIVSGLLLTLPVPLGGLTSYSVTAYINVIAAEWHATPLTLLSVHGGVAQANDSVQI